MTVKTTKDDYIRYRIKKAWMTFQDAKYLASVNSWNSSMNRLYYACFYAVLALFSKYNITSRKHAGAKTQFLFILLKQDCLKKKQEDYSETCLT